jgi:tetratricopeptide (TPR) repeat protein
MASSSFFRPLTLVLMAVAVFYAALAGLQTVGDFDTGWFLAGGRYVLQHHRIPSTDVFSYTAKGAPWIYPPLSGVVLYLVFLAGGFAALSWLNAAAGAGVAALLCRGGGWVTALLAIVAVPLLAARTAPRGELFSTVLFAAYAGLLWRQFERGQARLWLLPVLMVAWVNLHPGFVAGLALLAGYVGLEILEMPFSQRRSAALTRLRTARPWILAAVAATLLNRWGPFIYSALMRQEHFLALHTETIGEWSGVRINSGTLAQALRWREPNSAYWWLLLFAIVAAAVALARKQIGTAVWLSAAAYVSATHLRLQALFAIVVVVAGGSVLEKAVAEGWMKSRDAQPRRLTAALGVVSVAFIALVGLRAADLVTNRAYLANSQISLFGTGLSWWYPERAMDFLGRERLPPNLFNEYSLGGYLAWKAGPHYPDYIDGRALPFGPELYFRQRRLQQEPLDSPDWQREADGWGINTLVFSTARYAGLAIPLQEYCRSRLWRPVYLDDVSVIFLRNTPQNAALIQRLGIDCSTVKWNPPEQAGMDTRRGRAELYNYYANGAAILYLLERDHEAMESLNRAQQIFGQDPNLLLTRAQLLQAEGKAGDAEADYRRSLSLRPTDVGWYALGQLYAAEHRYSEAADAIQRAAQISVQWRERYALLGQIYAAMNAPRQALDAYENADASAPEVAGPEFSELRAQVAEGKARAWRTLGELERATRFQQDAVRCTPENAQRWLALADLYQAGGALQQAQEARSRAGALLPPKQP